jgi:hypothetical protein
MEDERIPEVDFLDYIEDDDQIFEKYAKFLK